MRIATLFIAPREADKSLRDVASGAFHALGMVEWEERDSSNYLNGHYFAGYCENAEVTVYDGDDDRTSDYPFHLSVENPSWRKGPGVLATDLASIAKALVAGGFAAFVPTDTWQQTDWDGDGDVYAT